MDRDWQHPADVQSPFLGARAEVRGRSGAADTIIIAAAVVAGLYFGHDILVPIALAVLLSFVLAPVAGALAYLKFGKVASVLLAVAFALAILLGLGAVIGRQVADLAHDLPEYQTVVVKKLDAVKNSSLGSGVVEKAAGVLKGLDSNLIKPAPPATGSAQPQTIRSPEGSLMQVEVHEPAPGPIQILQSIVSALLPPLATAGIVVIFVIFILLQRTDLRDRFIGLIGSDDLHRTTQALDDAAGRLSRYFLALTAINAAFGLMIGIGLSLIGVPNPVLWGIVGGVLRFVPYLGAFISAVLPLALAAAVDPGWGMVAETAVLFLVLEGFMGQVVEPQLFGHTTGMSPLAIIIAAAFWTLVWGPPGLLLSTPITACIVVLGRHIESLKFLELMLGDRPALSPIQSFYQRILATDPDEVAFQAESLLSTLPLQSYYEEVALPALAMAQQDATRGVLDPTRQEQVCESVERVVADLADHVDAPDSAAADLSDVDNQQLSPSQPKQGEPRCKALCIAGRSPLDKAAAAIVAQLLERKGASCSLAGPEVLAVQGIFALQAEGLNAIVVMYLDHRSLASVRFSVRRLRKKFPGVPIAVCMWGGADLSAAQEAAKADATVASLSDVIAFCLREENQGKIPERAAAVAPAALAPVAG